MAKPWQDVVADERFQNLDDAQKENARQQYFEEVVAPNVPADQVESIRLQFNEDTKHDDLELQQEQYEERPLGEVTGERLERGMLNLRSAKAMKGAADVAERAGEQRREYGLRPSAEPEEPYVDPTRQRFARSAISARPGEISDPAGRPLISETGETMSTSKRVMGEAMTREREKVDRLITLANTTAEESEKIPMAPVAKAAFKAKSFTEAWGIISKAPMSFIGEVGTTSLPLMAEPVAKGSIGMAIGGPLFGMLATAEGSYNVDYAAELRGEMQRQGINIKDVADVREAMMNPEVFRKIKKNAQAHAEMVAIFDGLSMGVASKTLVPKALSNIVARQVVNVPVQAAVQSVTGATGEAFGQLAADRELEWGEILAEAAGEFITAPVDVVVAGVGAKRQQSIKAQQDKVEQLAAELNKAITDRASEMEIEARTREVEEAEKDRIEIMREAFEEYEQSESAKKVADQEKGFEEITKTTVVPADIEPAAPTTAGQIEQSLAAEKAERAISEKPKSAMEAAFEAAKPEKKYGLPVEEAATQVDTAPTDAQKEAGNYKKGHTKIQGMDVAIENPKGSMREGTDESGKKWSQKMDAHYGYIKKTQGADGDHVDVFLGSDAETADTFYVVNQKNPATGKFDEHKVMIGYPDEKAAKAGYMANYEKNWKGFDSMVPLNTEQFKRFVHSKAKTSKALPESATILLSRGQKKATPAQQTTLSKMQDKANLNSDGWYVFKSSREKNILLELKKKGLVTQKDDDHLWFKPVIQQKPKAIPKKKGFVAVSPNDWDAEMSFSEATESIRSEKHQTSHAITDEIYDELGLKHTTHDALGDWADGAEDSLLVEVDSPESMAQLKYTASLTGKFFNQKGSLSFISDEKGKDSFYKIEIPIEKGDINAIRSSLDKLKLAFRTLVPGPTGTTVVIYDEGTTLEKSVSKLGKQYETDIEAYKGKGELIGSWDSRQEGIAAYSREIGVWERKNKARYTPKRKGLRDFWGTGYQEQGTETQAASRTVAAPVPLSRLNSQPIPDVYGKFGALDVKKDTTESLKFYNLDKLVANPGLVNDMIKRFGFEVKYFSFHVDEEAGVEFVIPKLKKQGYKDGFLWIYDPRVAHGSFKDTEYTRQWRIVHELGHAITEDFMQKRYGDSRREGRLGQSWMATRGHPDKKQVQVELAPLTLKEAQRAVEWEDVAFRVQRMLFESLGITVDPTGFAHEYNTNVADASYRVLTGDFGDPGEYGFVPRGTLPEVKSVLKMFENTEIAMAKEQGRKPTKGINLSTYKRISLQELKTAISDAKKADAPLIMKIRAAKKGAGLSVPFVEKTAAIIQKKWVNAPEIFTVKNTDELPQNIKESLIATDSIDSVMGMYLPEEGVVYLVADRIGSKEDLFTVIMHEIMGHHGLRGIFGDDINPFLEEVYRNNKEAVRDLAKGIGVQLSPKNRLEMTEEYIANQAQVNPQSTLITRLISKISQWIRKILPSTRLTDSEIRELVVGMRQAVRTGEAPQLVVNAVKQIQNDLKATNETDPTATHSIARFVKRHFTKEGLLNDEGFEAKIKSDSLKKAGEEDVSFVVHKFEEALNKAFGVKNYASIPEAELLKINDYLHGEKVSIPTELKEVLDGMRVYIDRLSAGMQKSMVDMMAIQRAKLSQKERDAFDALLKSEPDGYLPASIRNHYEMHETISKNMGTYLNRSYEAFDNEKWKNKALKDKDLISRAEAYIAERNPNLTPDEVHGAVRAILQAAKDKGNFFSFISGGTKYGQKDVSMLSQRKDIPDVIRELLGEYLDPRINFVRTSTNMYNFLANHEFLMQLRAKGLGVFLFERPIGTFDKQISAKGAESMNPIDGLFTTEDFIQGLEDMRDAIEGGAVMRSFIRLNSAVKYGKTILAPTTQARNFMSAAMFSVMNGHFNWAHGQKAFRAAQSDLFTKDVKWRKYLTNLISLGVLHDNPRAEELRHALEDFMKIDIYSKGPTKSLRRFLNFMQRLYQVGDDFWKIIGFENEVALQMKTGLKRKDAEVKAAFRIRNGYPTYSMVPRAVKMVRRWPLIGTFVSFPYEIVRTTANQVKFLKDDVMAGNKEMVARRTLGMAMATSISATLSYMSMVMMGLDSDDDESVRALAAPWVRNSQLIYLGYDESGYPKYIDFSYFDPYTYLKKPITAILNKNNEGIDKKVMDSLVEFLEPFIGVDIAAGALVEIYSNKRAGTGTKIYNEEAPTDEIAMDMINHFRKAAQPGGVSNAERMMKAIRGETSASGKEYKIEDEAVALIGFRMGTLNVPQSIYYKTLEFKDVKSSATQQLNKVVGSGTKVTEKDIKRGFSGMIRARKKGFTEMIKMATAAEKLGVKKSAIHRILKAAKVNSTDIRYILNGKIPPWRMTSSFMDAAETRALATANKENRRGIRKEFYKRKKYVNQLMNEQKLDKKD